MIYLLLNEGYLPTAHLNDSRDLLDDAQWLTEELHQLMPTEPEIAGLLALIRLHRARADARFDAHGALVLLENQDRSRWNRRLIDDATHLIERAAQLHRPGPYQLQAAIVACHAHVQHWDDTDWEQILLLYNMLLHLAPSPITRLHRAIALRYVSGAHRPLWSSSTPSPANSSCITSIMPRAPSSCAHSTTRSKPVSPTGVLSSSRQIQPNKPYSSNASTGPNTAIPGADVAASGNHV